MRNTTLPSGDLFEIDLMRCQNAAESLAALGSGLHVASPFGRMPRNEYLLFKLAFVAICHQFNWNFLEQTLAREIGDLSTEAILDRIKKLAPAEFASWFEAYPKKERIRAKERIKLLQNLVQV